MIHWRNIPETCSGVLIRGLWEIQMDSIIDVIFVDADTDTYVKEGMDKLVLSVDGMLGKHAAVVLATLSQLMTTKME